MKKVALVHDWLNGFAGAEQVLLSLLEIYPEAPIYTSVWNQSTTPQFAKYKVVTSYLQKIPFFRTHHQPAIPLMPQAFESFDFKGFDVIISITSGMAKGIITQPGQTHICYCNTPIRYAWRLGGDDRVSGWLKSRIAHQLRIWDVVSADRVDHFIGNSNNVAKRIEKIYRRPSTVIYPPVNTDRFDLSDKKPGDYFLSVGRLVGYKRIDLIVQACLEAGLPLKIVGSGPEEELLRSLAKNSPLIEFLGRVPDAELKSLYEEAKAFIFAADEDFGIVPVEAMSAGRPVVAYGRGGAMETVVDGVTGGYFSEQTVASLAKVLTEFKAEQYDPAKIRAQALKFSKANFQKAMQNLVESQV